MVGETPLESISGVKKMQTFVTEDCSNQSKNMNIDLKKHIIDVTGDVTMAKGMAMAGKDPNS